MKGRRPLVWGHRGAMDFAPQNTIPSFLLAQEQGADGIELDVQLTKDGVLVVFHDATIDRLTEGTGPLASLTWNEVKVLDAGRHFGAPWRGTRIPTLEDVLAAVDARMTVNVELKTALSEESWWERWRALVLGSQTVPPRKISAARSESNPLAVAAAQILRQGLPGRFLVSSFDPLALEAIAPLVPEIPLGFLHSPTNPWNTPALMQDIPHHAWHPHYSEVSVAAIAHEHGAGRKVHVWTVNDGSNARKLTSQGVDALITNRPGEILAVLEN